MGLSYNTDAWIRYQYKLNENFKDNCDSKQLEGTTIKKEVWTIFPQKIAHLSKYIKTIENEDGILDYECFHQIKGEIYDSSVNNYNKLKEGKVPTYSLATLSVMPRTQLQEIANLLGVDSMHKVHHLLVQAIVAKQQIIKDILKKSK